MMQMLAFASSLYRIAINTWITEARKIDDTLRVEERFFCWRKRIENLFT